MGRGNGPKGVRGDEPEERHGGGSWWKDGQVLRPEQSEGGKCSQSRRLGNFFEAEVDLLRQYTGSKQIGSLEESDSSA